MIKSKYKDDIHPDFWKIAHNIPFCKPLLKMAAPVQALMLKLVPVPGDLHAKKVQLSGFNGLPFRADVIAPKDSEQEKLPCLLYIHGGGFGYKAAPYHKRLACIYAREANCRVVFPDYHLMPDYVYPAAYEDILATYRWICTHTEELKIDGEHIAVGGDSAGAVLTSNICNMCNQMEGLKTPCFQMLIYPATDAKMETDSMKKYTDTPLWNAVNNKIMWDMYLSRANEKERKMASPMDNDLPGNLPDTYIEVAKIDCLHDEGLLYADKLKAMGAAVTVNKTRGTIHGYDSASKSQIVKNSLGQRINALKKGFDEK